MNKWCSSASKLQGLAACWQIWAKALIALARQISMVHKQNAHGGAANAAMLEAQLYVALVELSGEIAAHDASGRGRSRKDREALAYLRTIHAMLGVITLIIRQLRCNLEAAAEQLAGLRGKAVEQALVIPPAPIVVPGYLDSG